MARTPDLHPLVVDGQGHTSLTNIELFAGNTPVVSSSSAQLDDETLILSEEFLLVEGSKPLTVALLGCRMSTFRAENLLTIRNRTETISTHDCFQSTHP